ncbi:AAA family ATPase [Algoriphagus yeomjeoni]|uniref:ATPase family protein associated with various cellular activities (AAA) n=1 Tax=Algoriphagus yeomjeoni TaxID=291403 RepID=A0A327P3C4_9BACT|nr:ATP-binding protein [Algoriphagus yeomjeoni]RAI86805.1 ATPase family protein associated with various cellular activities (AAA) [Algoriphagus yeomjeoni]
MAAAEQIKSLIKSFGEGDESRFYATAMQIAAAEARKGHVAIAEELKKLIDKGKSSTSIVKRLPVNAAQKELNDLLELVSPEIKLNHMVLSSEIQETLAKVIHEQRHLKKLLSHNLQPRRKLLLVGTPGSGKTMTAHALAGELGLPLFIIRLDGLISRYLGESIAKLRLIFDAMVDFRAVYLFDEFDSIGSNRTQGQDVGEIKRVLNSFLLQIEKDRSNSLIIAATNLPESLDTALFRRFDDIIQYGNPSLDQILQIYSSRIDETGITLNWDLQQLAQLSIGLSYAEVHKICEDIWKDFLIYGKDYVTETRIIQYIENRKRTF